MARAYAPLTAIRGESCREAGPALCRNRAKARLPLHSPSQTGVNALMLGYGALSLSDPAPRLSGCFHPGLDVGQRPAREAGEVLRLLLETCGQRSLVAAPKFTCGRARPGMP